jgi:hypothetical protein
MKSGDHDGIQIGALTYGLYLTYTIDLYMTLAAKIQCLVG